MHQVLPKARIALVSPPNIQGGLLYALIANNLSRNGYQVVLFNDELSQLQSWLPQYRCAPYTNMSEFESSLKQYDAVITDISSPLIQNRDESLWESLAHKYICLSLGIIPESLIYDHSLRLSNLGESKFEHLKAIALSSGSLRMKTNQDITMVEHVTAFCKDTLKLENVTPSLGLHIPSQLVKQKYHNRLILHPSNMNDPQHWPPIKFLKLARKLKQNGWQVEFLITPEQRRAWHGLIKGEFNISSAESLAEVSAYMYQSRAFIGLDSGISHLASALGLPVLSVNTLHPGHALWRPGWAPSENIRPAFTIKWIGRGYWKPFISVRRAYESFNQFISEHTRRSS